MEFPGLNARVTFDFGGDRCLVIDAKSTPPAISHEAADVDCTIRLTLDNLGKLMAGALSPTPAYTMGKFKIEGSMGVTLKVAALLEE
jgi:putative sterol carrier protein